MEGLNKLINSISDIRNEQSKMHAVGEKEVEMEEHHAILCLNAAITLGEFFLSLDEKQCDCIFEEKK
ncbi:MAG: abortive infection family protein [Bacteroidales bacterium]|nr:abortive infection family protein [Bacteroidales bacterium]